MSNFTKNAIKASFVKLLNEQPLNKISVRSIVEDCGINRNSFYYHFQDIPALMEEIITEQTTEIIRQYPSISSLEECFHAAFAFVMENKNAVLHIYHSVSRDLFESELLKTCDYIVRTYIRMVYPERKMAEPDHEILIRFAKCELFGLIIEWIINGMNSQEIQDLSRAMVLFRNFPEDIWKCSENGN